MRVLELHKIQSYPVSCLNRDDAGSPKTATYGGVDRSRISSQCSKRAKREFWKSRGLPQFKGVRTKFVLSDLKAALIKRGLSEPEAETRIAPLGSAIGKPDEERANKLKTLIFVSPSELDRLADALAELPAQQDPKKLAASVKKAAEASIKNVVPNDAADIALFGRMFASDDALNVEASCMVAHAITTHKNANQPDYFAAVDENKPNFYENEKHDEGAGAGMIDSLEFTTGTFYHYAALDLDNLRATLPDANPQEIRFIIRSFVEAFALAIPNARKNSMNAHTRPAYVLATIQTGQALQMGGAFEVPVKANGHGYETPTIERLRVHFESMKSVWGISYDLEVSIPDVPFPDLLEAIEENV